jgi:hypothetical protein
MSSIALSTLTRRLTNLSFQTASSTATASIAATTTKTASTAAIATTWSRSIQSYACAPLTNNMNNNTIRQFSSSEDKNDADAEWRKFQKTLIYDADATKDSNQTKGKKRGGKVSRKKKEKEMKLLDKQEGRMFDVGTGQFPPLRYSDEETQRLLDEAYSMIPPRGGSKKTRQLKRQKNRFKTIRRMRYIKKQEKIAHHFDRMAKRSLRTKLCQEVISGAVDVRERDSDYQKEVLRKWASMQGIGQDSSDSGDEKQQEM